MQVEDEVEKILNDETANYTGRRHLIKLLEPVRTQIVGQIRTELMRIQASCKKNQRKENNKLCREKCTTGSIIHNFTECKVPVDLANFLKNGLNNVPEMVYDKEVVISEIEDEVKRACSNLFTSLIGEFPRAVSFRDSLDTFIRNLIVLAPSHEKLVSSLISLREAYHSRLPDYIRGLKNKTEDQVKFIQDQVPDNCILSPSDKNLGVCLLPVQWYKKEYEGQVEKGGYELQNITEEQCLGKLIRTISEFKGALNNDQSTILKDHWPKYCQGPFRIGVLKIVPKIHKLIGPITKDSWEHLKSRPIRGAEQDPMRHPSKALYSMLKMMLSEFKHKFPAVNSSNQTENFTVLSGCDDYLGRLGLLKLDSSKFSKTILLTADFSDAFTETQIPRLQESISVIGYLLGYASTKTDLIVKMVSLVFSNCYFSTPFGLYRQSKGMPMGDYSSRDALDVDLTRSEYEIISQLSTLPLEVHLYCRLVDDISIISQGNFQDVIRLVEIMGERYPTMPLNLQVSFNYSRFLDLKINNYRNDSALESEENFYKLSTNLAYKIHSNFTYTPKTSNIHPKYKTAVVPISLYRAHTRCTDPRDINHHISFMKNICQARNQDMAQVKKKYDKFFQKRRKPASKNNALSDKMIRQKTTPITYDCVSDQHKFVGSLIKDSFTRGALQLVYRSRQNVGSAVCPKRKTIKKVGDLLLRGTSAQYC